MNTPAPRPRLDPPTNPNGSLHDGGEGRVLHPVAATEGAVRKSPLVAVGIAMGAGVATGLVLGVVGQRMLSARTRPISMFERLGVVAGIGSAISVLTRLSTRLAR